MQNLNDFAKSDLEKLEILADNFEWFYAHKDNLRKEFKNEYVAVKDRNVLYNDIKLERLVKRLNLRNYDESIAICSFLRGVLDDHGRPFRACLQGSCHTSITTGRIIGRRRVRS